MYSIIKHIVLFILVSFTAHSQNILPKGEYIYDGAIVWFFLDQTENSCVFTIVQGKHIPLEVKCEIKTMDTLLYFYYLETLNGYYESRNFNTNKLIFTAIKIGNDLKVVNFYIEEFSYYFEQSEYPIILKKQ